MENVKEASGTVIEVGRINLLKESIKKALYSKVEKEFDDETLQATREMTEERENAIKLIAEEQRKVITQIVEDERKTIWSKVTETKQSEIFNSESIKDGIAQAYARDISTTGGINESSLEPGNNHHDTDYEEKVELEILPPRDQNEISTINTYLINMPEAKKVELVTLVDKSVFKVKLSKPVDFIEKLGSLPQVLNAEEVIETGQRKIKIALSAKSKLERNQNEMNEKVNRIFTKKK